MSHTQEKESDDTTDTVAISRQETNESLGKRLADAHDSLLSPAKLRLVLLAMSVSLMFNQIDMNGIAVALPQIANDLDAQLTISWAGTSQVIANCCCQLLSGRFADIFGRKNMLVFMTIFLGFFDLACGLAKTDVQFYIFRALCGIANGNIMSLAMMVMSDHTTLRDRGKYQGYITAFVGLGSGLGPVIGSSFAQQNSWRHFYFTLFAVITSSSLIIVYLIPGSKKSDISIKEKLRSVDYIGWVLGSLGLILVLIPINSGGLTWEWNDPRIIAMFVVGGVSFICFFINELYFAKLPLVPLRVFNSYQLAILFLQGFLSGIAFYPLHYYYAYYFEMVRNFSVLKAACFSMCVVGPHCIASVISGRTVSHFQHFNPVLRVGFGAYTLAFSLLAGVVNQTTNIAGVALIMVVNGIGQGMTFQNTLIASLSHSRTQDRAVVISTRNTMRSFGGSCGLAFSALIFSSTMLKNLKKDSYINQEANSWLRTYLKEHVYSKIDFSQLTMSTEQHTYVNDLYMRSVKNVFTFWAPVIGFAFVLSWLVKDHGLISKFDEQKNKEESKVEPPKDEEEKVGTETMETTKT